jgi:hypothetical protein
MMNGMNSRNYRYGHEGDEIFTVIQPGINLESNLFKEKAVLLSENGL